MNVPLIVVGAAFVMVLVEIASLEQAVAGKCRKVGVGARRKESLTVANSTFLVGW